VSEALTFGATLERLLEVFLVIVVGAMLPVVWSWTGLAIGVALLVVVRPLAVQLALVRTPTSFAQRWLLGWFGVRGIGSVYYLAYALQHGAHADDTAFLVSVTVSVIALSIVVHGTSASPLLARYERSLHARTQ
jgi:sodium/hydrogen antiporter